jgi:hypothetical protein
MDLDGMSNGKALEEEEGGWGACLLQIRCGFTGVVVAILPTPSRGPDPLFRRSGEV